MEWSDILEWNVLALFIIKYNRTNDIVNLLGLASRSQNGNQIPVLSNRFWSGALERSGVKFWSGKCSCFFRHKI